MALQPKAGLFYRAVVEADLEGIVAKRLTDAYQPKRARWHRSSIAATRSGAGAPSGFASEGRHHVGRR
jgi:hypothetical protein